MKSSQITRRELLMQATTGLHFSRPSKGGTGAIPRSTSETYILLGQFAGLEPS